MEIKACIFDLDGTILYTLEAIAKAGNRMLNAMGYPEQPLDDYRYHCGDGSRNLVIRCLDAVGANTPERVELGDTLNRRFLAEDPLAGVKPYDGIEDVLHTVKENGVKLAVCSNKPHAAAQETVRGIFGDLFDYVQGQTAAVPIKPDPTGALNVCKMLGVRPEDCLYFGDTWTDMQTGRNAGMYTVGCLWGYRDREELEENGADTVIEKPHEILNLFESLKK